MSKIITNQVYSTSRMEGTCLTVPALKNKKNFWTGVFIQKCVVTYSDPNPGTETFSGKFNFTIATTPHGCTKTLIGTRIQGLVITDQFLRTVFVVREGVVLYDMGIIGTGTINEIKAIVS